MEFWRFFWNALFTFCYKRKMAWFLPVIYHIPSVISWPAIDHICFSGNNTSPCNITGEQLIGNGKTIEDVYLILLQLSVFIIFGCHTYVLICAYVKDFADEKLIENLSKINQPTIKAAEIWRIARFEKPFNFVLFNDERILLFLEFLYTIILVLRFSFLATCGLIHENITAIWKVSIFQVRYQLFAFTLDQLIYLNYLYNYIFDIVRNSLISSNSRFICNAPEM